MSGPKDKVNVYMQYDNYRYWINPIADLLEMIYANHTGNDLLSMLSPTNMETGCLFSR